MLKLYGFAVSNYFNMVKHSLLHKGIDFDEVTVYPSAEPDYLRKSPLGKVPCIETDQGFLAETSVIVEYLDARYPEQPLLPSDEWQRAKCRELMKIIELYLELPARRLLPAVLGAAKADDGVVAEVAEALDKGVRALSALVSPQPFVMGEQMTAADIVLRYALVVVELVSGALYQRDICAEVAGLPEWKARMAEMPISQQLDAESEKAMAAFMAMVQGK